MRRRTIIGTTALALVLAACSGDPSAVEISPGSPTGSAGRIVFQRYDPSIDGPVTYTINPDGSDVQQLFSDGHSESARWSPDGTAIQIFCCGDGNAAHLVDPESGEMHGLPVSSGSLEVFCGGAWSPDGDRLACEVFGPRNAGRNGVYSIRSSDGGDLTRITTNRDGYDTPGDFSPDGQRIVFARFDADEHARLYVANVDGTDMLRISGRLVGDLSHGRWSPTGDQILFAARRSDDHHKSIWIVNADGGSLRELTIDARCGGLWSDPEAIGCYSPAWSPDGSRIVYVRSTPAGDDEGIYIANADGTGSVRLTDGEDDQPDWGMPAA